MTGPGRIVGGMKGVSIGDTLMVSENTGHRAQFAADPDGPGGAWTSTRLPGRRLTRSQAISSMVLCELEAAGQGGSPNAANVRAELGITWPGLAGVSAPLVRSSTSSAASHGLACHHRAGSASPPAGGVRSHRLIVDFATSAWLAIAPIATPAPVRIDRARRTRSRARSASSSVMAAPLPVVPAPAPILPGGCPAGQDSPANLPRCATARPGRGRRRTVIGEAARTERADTASTSAPPLRERGYPKRQAMPYASTPRKRRPYRHTLTAEQRSANARRAVLLRWSRTADRTAALRPARDAYEQRFYRGADAAGVTDPALRERMAADALRAEMIRLRQLQRRDGDAA